MRLKALLNIAVFFLTIILTTTAALPYDATYNFTQPSPELVSGFKAKAGPTKGGPYTVTVDCHS